jgi:hypothetical protein
MNASGVYTILKRGGKIHLPEATKGLNSYNKFFARAKRPPKQTDSRAGMESTRLNFRPLKLKIF